MIYDLQKEYVGLCHSAGKTPRSLPLIDKSPLNTYLLTRLSIKSQTQEMVILSKEIPA